VRRKKKSPGAACAAKGGGLEDLPMGKGKEGVVSFRLGRRTKNPRSSIINTIYLDGKGKDEPLEHRRPRDKGTFAGRREVRHGERFTAVSEMGRLVTVILTMEAR